METTIITTTATTATAELRRITRTAQSKEFEGHHHNAANVVDSHQFPDNEEPKVLGHGPTETTTAAAATTTAATTTAAPYAKKLKFLCNFEDAPAHLKFNPYIRSGYRTFLSNKLCLQSVFWWTNETINIWSHLFGCFLFVGLTICDFQFLQAYAQTTDQLIVLCLLTCFCLCMLLSSIYHIFSCCSEEHYELFLSADFIGIALSLVAIYISGMYYAFWCFEELRNTYSLIALFMFGLALIAAIPKLNIAMNVKIAVLLLWAAYGIVPLMHWIYAMGGLQNELVKLMIPRIITMYSLCAIAFVFYAAKIPERWLTGYVDYIGHSHNWWHLIILGAFYHWHNTGLAYAEYRSFNTCAAPVLY